MQRRRLLLATVEVLAEHGLEEMHVGRICARAGVSRRTFYDLYEDREACLLAAFQFGTERLTHKLVTAYQHPGRWRERVRVALAVLLEAFDEDPGFARLCLIESLKGAPPVLEFRQNLLQGLAAVIEEGRVEAKTEPPALTAQSTVGGAVSVIQAKLFAHDTTPLIELLNPLMSMIVYPYLGSTAARKELCRSVPAVVAKTRERSSVASEGPFKDLPIRITFRTARVLGVVAAQPGSSNREIAQGSGVIDQGQMSKLLRRLEGSGLIENRGEGQAKGEPNAWQLTERGQGVLRAVTV
jgi:AcrR family transcriptional regulator/DNA-binding MarR family transcriptional regulator